jgi:vitamin B12 transporter
MRIIIALSLSFLLFSGATAALADPLDAPPPAEREWATIAQAEEDTADSEQQAASETEEVQLLEPVVVTATRIETPVGRLGSSVTVITREELEQLGSPTVIEALRQVPGLDVIQTGGYGGTTSVFTRGGRSDFTLIMIDGVPLTDQAGTADIGHLTIDNIEQIEVVRGPQSALYGAEALSGVINIITRKGEGKPTVTFDLEGGNIGNNYESAGLSGSTDIGFNYSVAASHFGSDNLEDLDNDDYDNYTVSSRVGYDFNEDATLTTILRAQYSKLGLPGPTEFLPEDPDDKAKNTQVVFTTLFDQRLTDWWSHVVQASYFYQNYKNKDPESQDPLFINDIVSDYDAKIDRVDVDYHQNFFVLDNQIFTIGTEWEEEQADIDSTSDFGFGPTTDTIDKQRHNLAFYAQASLSFWDRLNLLAGVRYDDNSVFGSETSPRFAASYLIKETGTRLKGSYGEGIKNPSFIDLYYPMFGNPDLEAEKSKAWDAGFEQALWGDRLTFGVTYFHSDFDNLIAFAFPAPQNIEIAKSEGVEVELKALLPYHFSFRGAYTYTKTEDGEGHRLLRVPRNLVSLNLNYTYERLMLNLDSLIVSERPDSAFVDLNGDFINDITDNEANGYVKLDIAGEYRLTENLWLVARVNNLLDDEHYEEALGFENPGINFLAGVRGVF